MATRDSVLAWETLWIEEPSGLWFMGSQRVGQAWVTKQQCTKNLANTKDLGSPTEPCGPSGVVHSMNFPVFMVDQLVRIHLQWRRPWFDSWVGKIRWRRGEGTGYPLPCSWASLVAQRVKNLTAMQETWVWSLSWEDPLEKVMATHSSILAWRIPWTL